MFVSIMLDSTLYSSLVGSLVSRSYRDFCNVKSISINMRESGSKQHNAPLVNCIESIEDFWIFVIHKYHCLFTSLHYHIWIVHFFTFNWMGLPTNGLECSTILIPNIFEESPITCLAALESRYQVGSSCFMSKDITSVLNILAAFVNSLDSVPPKLCWQAAYLVSWILGEWVSQSFYVGILWRSGPICHNYCMSLSSLSLILLVLSCDWHLALSLPLGMACLPFLNCYSKYRCTSWLWSLTKLHVGHGLFLCEILQEQVCHTNVWSLGASLDTL